MNRLNVSDWKQLRLTIELLLQRSQMDDWERLLFAEFHSVWESGRNYGSNEYVRYGENEQGKAGLYRSDRNINNSAIPPDQPANPRQWVFVGWSAFEG